MGVWDLTNYMFYEYRTYVLIDVIKPDPLVSTILGPRITKADKLSHNHKIH